MLLWTPLRLRLATEDEEFHLISLPWPTRSRKTSNNTNWWIDLTPSSCSRTGTSSIDSKCLPNSSDKCWQLSDSTCWRKRTRPSANCMLLMMRMKVKYFIYSSWRIPNLSISLIWLWSRTKSRGGRAKEDQSLTISREFWKNWEKPPSWIASDIASTSRISTLSGRAWSRRTNLEASSSRPWSTFHFYFRVAIEERMFSKIEDHYGSK